MDERILLKIALISSIIGLMALFFIAQRIEITQTQIHSIDQTGQDVLIKGVVTRLTDKEGLMFLEVTMPEKISVVMFKNNVIDVEKGDAVEIRGKTQEFQGQKEIVADEVRIVG